MMKTKTCSKKILSLIIAALMIVTMLPTSVFANEQAAEDVMIEEQAEVIVEEAEAVGSEVVEEAAEVPDVGEIVDAAIDDGSVDEIVVDPEELAGYTDPLSLTVQGVKSGSKLYFDAQLSGLSVSAAVPAKRAAAGSYMTADIVDVSAYEDAVAKLNYGKSVSGMYGLELHFYNKKGKEIKNIITSDVTVTIDDLGAQSYFIGRIENNKVKKIQKGTEPTFTFKEKKAYTYVIAGLVDDGLLRAFAETDGDGNKRFNLNDENVSVEVIAPEGAFADDVAMEASDASGALPENGGEELVGASDSRVVGACEITFYDEEGAEQQPKKDVTVKIAAALDMTKDHVLIHVADDGSTSIVENAIYTEDGVQFITGSFSTFILEESGSNANPGTTITFNTSALGLKAASTKIAANKTVTDNDRDGIYELALNVTGQSEQSTTSEVQKQNVVMVIDVSGSMNTIFDRKEYTYSSSTYSQHSTYYALSSSGEYIQVVHEYHWPGGTGWYTTGLFPIKVGGAIDGLLNIFDGTTIYYGETRLDATKTAANAVVDALLAYNTNDDNITDMFEISVVKFANKNASQGSDQSLGYNGTETIIHKSTDATAIKNAINGLEAGGGTNWQAALTQAKAEADGELTGTDEKTSVIFLTDGFPTFYGNDNGSGSETANNIATSYNNARASARAIVTEGYTLYNIFAFGSDTQTYNGHTGYQYLAGLTNYAYGTGDTDNWNTNTDYVKNYCFNAKDPQALIDTFTTIVAHITNNVGYAGVSISDGVSLGATSTAVAINGSAKAESMRYSVKDASNKTVFTMTVDKTGKATFVIPNGDGTNTTLVDDAPESVSVDINGETKTSSVYAVTVGTGEAAKTYKMSPATIDADTGMVKWDLSGLGILENGYTYTVAFDVWPNQLAYDIAADLNNKIYTDIDAALTAYGVTDATERQHIKDALHKNTDGSYSLYTNYEQTVEYYPATSTTDDEGNVTWSYGAKEEDDLDKPGPILLKGSKLPLRKVWEAGLSIEEYNKLLWEDGVEGGTSRNYSIDLYVWKADTEADLNTMVNTGVTETNKPYITATLGWDTENKKYIWEKNIAVAPGTMVNLAEARTLGYDPDTNPDKVRTFTDNEGTAREYYVIEEGHYYYVTESGSDLHFELDTLLYHPMIVDGTLYNVGFGSGQSVEKMDPMYAVTATNKLKGGLNINKVASTTQITVADGAISNVTEPKDTNGLKTVTDEFTYEIKLWKLDDEGNKAPVYTYDDMISNGAAKSGSIGYRIFSEPSLDNTTGELQYGATSRGAILTDTSTNAALANGIYATITNEVTTIKLTMPANGEIRIVNLPAGTKYSVEEIVDSTGGYTYAATESKEQEGTSVSTGTVSTGNSVSGTIKGNCASIETFYNWAANFYVYHSSDNTIEKISFADARVAGEYDATNGYTYSFNIVEETKNQYLYGGYYKAYAGAKMTDNEIKAATGYAEKTGSTAYTYTTSRTGGLWLTDTTGAAAYAGDQTSWDKAKAYTAQGTSMAPSANTVYYLKEVPKAYLEPAAYVVYDTIDKDSAGYFQIKKLYEMTATDDANYKSVGFDVTTSSAITVNKTGSYASEFWGDKVTVTKAGASYAELHAGDIVKNHTGLIAGKDVTDYIKTNAYFRHIPYYVTLDNVKVTSLRRMIVYDRNTRWLNWTKPGMTKVTANIKAAYAALKK